MERDTSVGKFEEYLKRRFPGRRTVKDYVSDLRKFMASCPKAWRDVDMHDIDSFVDQQRQSGMKPATVKRRVAALKTFFDFLAEESGDLSWPNPVRMKRHAGKQPRRLPRDLSDEAVDQLWGVIASQRDRAWFALMLRAGLRVGEVASLKVEDILASARDGQPARLRVCGKGQKERTVLLTADAYAVLQAWLAERPRCSHPHVFLNERDGGPLSENGIEYCLRGYARQVGFPVTPHQLRHTYARQLTEAGMPVTSLGKLMGHAQVSTTQIYTLGADPELAQAYQQAMERLASTPLPPPTPSQTLVDQTGEPAAALSVKKRIVKEPDWEAWGTDLPTAVRQACLAFVRRRVPTWKRRRRGKQAKLVLCELHSFWSAQMVLRPIQHPCEITLQDLHSYQTWRSTQQVIACTVDHILSYVITLLRELAEQGEAVDSSVFRFRPRPRPESLPRHLPEAQAQRLEKYVSERLAESNDILRLENACFFVLAHAGLRAGECLDLCFQDLDLSGRRLFVRQAKGQRDRCVYLSDTACRALQCYLGSATHLATDPLFTLPNGRPISYMWLYEHLLALADAAGVPKVTPHRLRHTLATRLLNAGMEITRIQKLLGHEQVNTTMIYARILDQTVEADYRLAMHQIERQQMPLASTPLAVVGWPMEDKSDANVIKTLDNSV
jgi:site-specific recombinase XerD